MSDKLKVTKVEVYQSPDGWRWRAKAANGEVIASGESYVDKRGALRVAEIFNVEVVVTD